MGGITQNGEKRLYNSDNNNNGNNENNGYSVNVSK